MSIHPQPPPPPQRQRRSHSRRAARGSGHVRRLVSRMPWLLSHSWRHVVVLARSCLRVAKSRCRWRCSSASTDGTCTTCHPCRALCADRLTMRSSLCTFNPSLCAWRRVTSMEEDSTTWLMISCAWKNHEVNTLHDPLHRNGPWRLFAVDASQVKTTRAQRQGPTPIVPRSIVSWP
jgi:hypothetical protein